MPVWASHKSRLSLPAGEGVVASVAVRSVNSRTPKLLLRLRRGLKRFDAATGEVERQQSASSDWHAMLERAEAEDRDRRLVAAEAALNRLGRSQPH